jgi:hypothetical protein
MTAWGARPGEADAVREPRLGDLLQATLLVPVRSSSGESWDAARVPDDALRHGADESGPFLAAYTSEQLIDEFGPPGSDRVAFPARDLFARVEGAGERLIIDPGSPAQVDVPAAVLPFLAAGIDPTSPDAMAARRPHGELPPLEPPADIPDAFGEALRVTLGELPQVARAWLLRAGRAWTMGVEMASSGTLADYDEVRNRLHALATEHLGSRRDLIVTDLRAAPVREAYDAVAAPFYVAAQKSRGGFLSKLLGGD